MDTSNWINLGILVLGAIALLVTVIQAREARAARDESKIDRAATGVSAQEAADSAVKAADAQARTAAATEKLASSGGRSAEALESIARRVPWSLERVHPKGKQWRLRNESGVTLISNQIAAVAPEEQEYIKADFDLLADCTWSPNEFELLTFDGGTITSPPHVRFAVEYTLPDGRTDRWKGMLG